MASLVESSPQSTADSCSAAIKQKPAVLNVATPSIKTVTEATQQKMKGARAAALVTIAKEYLTTDLAGQGELLRMYCLHNI
ncbi:hypothetical protein EB796_003094 [Bugula neritina]|uniref:Uncharacterized protein n=1 Tax=Bugula neritina TaxID=10212 RepID=A0A7J7KKW5_BUGNE|nr:hypothetical protein EB796_003094 [Bugula neritina]